MPDIQNPYTPGLPVNNPDLFFGRSDVLASIRECLVKGRRVFLVSSARQMGRTSLLRQLSANPPGECVVVQVELPEEETRQLDWLLWRLADGIARQVEPPLDAVNLTPQRADFEGNTGFFLDHFWPLVRETLGQGCLVLLVDDLDHLDRAGSDLLGLFLAFLDIWRDRDPGLAAVMTVSAAREESLLREHPRLFGGAMIYALGPLSSEEASRLITWPVEGVLTYDYGVARRLIEATSGHPYYLQLLCSELFNRCAPAGWVNQRDVDLVVEALVKREIADFRQLWDESSPQEQAALTALVSLRGARGVATAQEVRTLLVKAGARVERGQVTRALDALTARGVLERLGALSYRFRVALLRDWLSERVELEKVVRNIRWVDRDRDKPGEERHVVKLPIGRARRPNAVPTGGRQAEEGSEVASARLPRRRPWLWFGGAVLTLGALAVALIPLLSGSWRTGRVATPSVTASQAAPLLTATLTPAKAATAEPTVTEWATNTPIPTVVATLMPTPPIVVARPLPSIAYLSRGAGEPGWSLSVMNSDGSDRQLLAEAQSEFLSPPSWSPDGSKIAFVSDRSGDLEIWVVDRDGSNPVNLTNHPEKDHSPAWSPDGEWIAFASVRDSLYWEIYLMRTDGSDVRRLTWWEDASDLRPSWSPDGSRLAFASKRDGNWEIYVMDRDGGNLLRLTDHPADDSQPAWSPDGSRIAFESTRDGFTDIFVMAAVGGQATNLTDLAWATDLGPTWSADGSRIAFYSDRDGEWDVYVMASDGSDVVKLTGDTTNDQVPAWRP